ncbi:MAG: hypothetical protein ACYCXA_00740 [Actinomycetes bacterium]
MGRPRVQLDHILATGWPAYRVLEVETMVPPVSDHCALRVRLDTSDSGPA